MTRIKWNNLNGNANAYKNPIAFSSVASLIDDVLKGDFYTDRTAGFLPAVNISENKENFAIELSVPGFKKEDFDVKVNENELTVSAEYKTENTETEKNFTKKEFSFSSFKRSFTLPETANTESIEGKYEAGILRLVIAKKEENKAKPVKEVKIS